MLSTLMMEDRSTCNQGVSRLTADAVADSRRQRAGERRQEGKREEGEDEEERGCR